MSAERERLADGVKRVLLGRFVGFGSFHELVDQMFDAGFRLPPQAAEDDRETARTVVRVAGDAMLRENRTEAAVDVVAAALTAARAPLLREIERLRGALNKIAYEPLGHAEATCEEVLLSATEIARAALPEPTP